MSERFSGESDEINRRVEEFSRDLDTHETFNTAKTAVFDHVAQLKDGYIAEQDIPTSIHRLMASMDRLIDLFIEMSDDKLSQPLRLPEAVDEWIEMTMRDAHDQDMRTFVLTKNILMPTLDITELRANAWGHIKKYGFDVYDKHVNNDAEDTGDDWIVDQYGDILYQRVSEILDYAPESISKAYEKAWDDRLEGGKKYSDEQQPEATDPHLEVYVKCFPEIAQSLATDIEGIEYGPAPRYIESMRAAISGTDMFSTYQQGVHEIRKAVQSNADNWKFQKREQTCYLFNEPAFIDGMIFGMAVNNRLLNRSADLSNISALNMLTEQTKKFTDTYIELAKKGKNVDAILLVESAESFKHNLAHPREIHAVAANELDNPFNDLARSMAEQLYDPDTSQNDIEDFYAGFGIARNIFNARRLQMIDDLEALFNHSP